MSGVDDFRDLAAADVISSSLFGGNYGMGIDVGFSYKWDRQWRVTASLVDLGFIYHTKNTREISASGNYEFDGIGFIYPTVSETNDEPRIMPNLSMILRRMWPTIMRLVCLMPLHGLPSFIHL